MRVEIDAFIRHLHGTGRSPRTVKTYAAVLDSLNAFLSREERPPRPDRADLEAFLARPAAEGGRRAPATRNQEIAALRAFAKFASRDLGWTLPVKEIPFVREAPRDPAVLTAPEIQRLFLAVANDEEGARRARNLAIVALLTQAGLRVHELVGLNVAQVDVASSTLLSVRGKGGTIHDLPLSAQVVQLLTDWLGERGALAQEGEAALFVSGRGERLSVRSVQRLFVKLREKMGTAKKVSPHTGRHSAATLALTSGADLSTVGDLLRHADLNTTRRYLHLVDERRRDAVRRMASAIPTEVLPTAASSNTAQVAPNVAQVVSLADVRSATEARRNSLDAQHALDDLDEAA